MVSAWRWLFFSFFSTARRKIPRTSSSTWSSHSDQVHFPFPSLRLVDLQVEERKVGNVVPSGQSPRRSPNNISFLVIGMLVTARPPFVHLFAWRLHPNTRNQAKGMLEVLRLAHVNSEFESRVSVRPSFRPVGARAGRRGPGTLVTVLQPNLILGSYREAILGTYSLD